MSFVLFVFTNGLINQGRVAHTALFSEIKSNLTSSWGSRLGLKWVKICSSGLRQTFAKTLRRPRCGIPITKLSTPFALETSIISFIAGINTWNIIGGRNYGNFRVVWSTSNIKRLTSQPSKPNLFSDDHFFAKKASNLNSDKTASQTYAVLLVTSKL